VWISLCCAELGEFEEAAALGAEALSLASSLGTAHELIWARLGLGRLGVVRMDFAGVADVLEPALPLCREGEFAVYFPRVASSLGMAYAALGRVEEGIAMIEQAVGQAGAIGFEFGAALTLAQLGEAYLLAGAWARAEDAGNQALEAAHCFGEQGNEAWALHLLGNVAAAQADLARATDRYLEALALAESLDMAPVASLCRADLGKQEVRQCVGERLD
jgi:tetratricopeptide (TPR) repeat protein